MLQKFFRMVWRMCENFREDLRIFLENIWEIYFHIFHNFVLYFLLIVLPVLTKICFSWPNSISEINIKF